MDDLRCPISIVVADDDTDDRELTRQALAASRLVNPVHFVEDGEELLEYLRHEGRYADKQERNHPGLILLDLNMPRMDGREALHAIKSDPKLKSIPIVVLTTSSAEEDIVRSYASGANSFICKPVTFEGLVGIVKGLGAYWFEIVDLPSERTSASHG